MRAILGSGILPIWGWWGDPHHFLLADNADRGNDSGHSNRDGPDRHYSKFDRECESGVLEEKGAGVSTRGSSHLTPGFPAFPATGSGRETEIRSADEHGALDAQTGAQFGQRDASSEDLRVRETAMPFLQAPMAAL